MRPSGHRRDDSWTSFGQRRGISDTARFGLDLTRTRTGSGGAVGRGSYPSPPMSGSPPLPPKTSPEVAERSQGTYQATTQDVYSGIPTTTQNEERTQTGAAGGPRAFFSDAPERAPYTFPRLDAPGTRPPPLYPQPLGQGTTQSTAYLPGPGTGAAGNHPGALPPPQTYPSGAHHPTPDALHDTPPKTQRKTKGHVASACVPCKKAHLRCDGMYLGSSFADIKLEPNKGTTGLGGRHWRCGSVVGVCGIN
ncbi:uncharacterized protein B0H64DRAFT_195156 [Chaetomium fimeti]|uniref:Zn(2)-C6 fungal-type domain-containing protein n=1 Tax=Chaetomium fimeti TaxID=1854472 RepID=A0AAE0HDX1_9PEZI|nr:hypothetical protein B0H64DRAFT_195156 [Chaetomium fimeti]